MKVLIFFIGMVAYATCSYDCYKDVDANCNVVGDGPGAIENCNAVYGAINHIQGSLQKYANANIMRSFEYLLLSTHFGNVEKSREGFEKLYRKMADSTWEDAIDLIKHITKRGGKMDFTVHGPSNAINTLDLDELHSLGRTLDTQKQLAEEAIEIHREVTRLHKDPEVAVHDPEIGHYIEEKLVQKHANTIRELSGHSNDLKRLLSGADTSLALFLFDEYLQKA